MVGKGGRISEITEKWRAGLSEISHFQRIPTVKHNRFQLASTPHFFHEREANKEKTHNATMRASSSAAEGAPQSEHCTQTG